jgi:tetratricopeptide (TPR) repeat protein
MPRTNVPRSSLGLVTSSDRENTKFGTAFLIYSNSDESIYLTCAHVVRDVGGPTQVQLDGEPVTATVGSGPDSALDLAVLRASPRADSSPLRLGAAALSGEEVTVVGFHAFGKHYVLRDVSGTLGKSIRLHGRGRAAPVSAWDLIMTDDELLKPGFSGAPVVYGQPEQVIGVVSHSIGGGERGVAVSIEVLPTIWIGQPSEMLEALKWHIGPVPTRPDFVDESIGSGGVDDGKTAPTLQTYTADTVRTRIGAYPVPPVMAFRDREVELAEFKEALKSYRIVGIVGYGGAGKTALACRALVEIEHSANQVGVIIYHTAANTNEITIEALVASLGRAIGLEHDLLGIYSSPGLAPQERILRIIAQFRTIDHLIVVLLDNLEKYQDQVGKIVNADLDEFITGIATQESSLRFVFTSRIRPRFSTAVTPSYHHLGLNHGLPGADAVALLRDLDPDDLGGLQSARPAVLVTLAERANCYPRALEALAGLLREDLMLTPDELGTSRAMLEGELVQKLVVDAITKLPDPDVRIIQLVAVFGEPVPEQAIMHLSGSWMPPSDVRSSLRRLVNSHFISFDKAAGLFSLHPIDRSFALSGIPACNNTEGSFCREELARRAASYYELQRKPRTDWLQYDDLRPLLREFDQLTTAGDFAQAAELLGEFDLDYLVGWGFAREALSLRLKIPKNTLSGQTAEHHFRALGQIYRTIGFLDEAIVEYQRIAEAQEVTSEAARGAAFNELSKLYRRMARYEDAIAYSERALDSAIIDERLDYRVDALNDMANICWCVGQYPKGLGLAEEALELVMPSQWQERKGYVECTVAKILMSGGRSPEAADHLIRAFDFFEESQSMHGQFFVNECFAEFYTKSHDLERAVSHIQRAIDLAARIGSLRGQGHGYMVLAKIHLERSDGATAARCAARAREFFEPVGVPEGRMAKWVELAGGALQNGDQFEFAEALLGCARSPANTGDLMDNREFAAGAIAVAERFGYHGISYAGRRIMTDLDNRIQTLL